MLPTIHQRTQVDVSYAYPAVAGLVPSNRYTVFVGIYQIKVIWYRQVFARQRTKHNFTLSEVY